MKPSENSEWKKIGGFPDKITAAEGDFLYELAQSLPKLASVVNIGVWYGLSTVALALACKGTAKRVWAVDNFLGSRWHREAGIRIPRIEEVQATLYQEFDLARLVYLLPYASEIVALLSWPDLWLVFIDGEHEAPYPEQDITLWLPHIQPGGIIAVHDYDPVGRGWLDVRAAVDKHLGHLETIGQVDRIIAKRVT